MFEIRLSDVRQTLYAAAILFAGTVHAQSNEFATGNMHFDAKEMDINGDRMITREEMIAYAEKTWEMMAHGRAELPIDVADRDFASGGVNYSARAIDTDHDGTISKDEYLAHATRKFDAMAKTDNIVSVDDMAKAIARGNTYPAVR